MRRVGGVTCTSSPLIAYLFNLRSCVRVRACVEYIIKYMQEGLIHYQLQVSLFMFFIKALYNQGAKLTGIISTVHVYNMYNIAIKTVTM